ncbi:helix-turn-helix domain-containing protein [Streptomyces sp. NPDC054796]
MPPRKDPDAAASVPAFYGAELRWKREAAGLTLAQFAEGCFYSVAYLSQIEMGERRMPLDFAQYADRRLRTDGFFERRCEDVKKARKGGHADYFADVVEQEKHAMEIEEWDPMLVPGPLQTEPYIRAVIRAANPTEAQEAVDVKVAARQARSWLFEEQGGPEIWLVLHEFVLHQPIVGPDEMAEQLDRVVAAVKRRRLIPQILPLNAGAHPFMMGTTRLMTFADAPPLMYTEGMYSGHIIDDPALVKNYMKAYGRLRAAALPPEASLAMIESATKDYANGKRTGGFGYGRMA